MFDLDESIFELINEHLHDSELMVKIRTIVDPSILLSSRSPLLDNKRARLAEKSSAQIDTDAKSLRKSCKFFFGYKGHIEVDI